MHARLGLVIAAFMAGVLPALVMSDRASASTFTASCSVASLRTALNDAEALVGPHTVSLAAGCTYRFSTVDSAANDDNALPVLTRDITIEGNGATFDRAAGAPAMRFLEVRGGDTVTIRDLTMTHGANPAPDGQVVTAGYAGRSDGGALRCTNAEIVLEDVVFEDNEAANGGAIFVESCAVALTRVTFSHNAANDGDGGGFAQVFQWSDGSDLNVVDCEFDDNSATDDGGGLFGRTFAIDVSGGAFRRNFAGGDGGGMWVEEPYLNYSVSMLNTTVSRNSADGLGGGVFVGDSGISMDRSSIWGNDAASGGGVAIGHSSEANNEVTSSTISGNHATSTGGGIYQYDWSALTLRRVTVADNDAPAADALRAWGEVNAFNTLIAYSSGLPAGALCDVTPGGWLVMYDVGSLSEGSCLGIPTIRAGAAELQPLAQNGGTTRTQAIGGSSAAKDAGDPSECDADQRGAPYAGTFGPVCDVGAYEWQWVAEAMPFNP